MPGETWHLDATGPLRVQTMGGALYFLFATDDASRFVVCYPLRRKDEQVDCFRRLQAWSRTQTGKIIKKIRSDGEWSSGEFKALKSAAGFEHSMTTPDTPQSNGVAERFGGIIVEKARTMLIDSGLPSSFAGEAIRCATYLHNITPRQTHTDTGSGTKRDRLLSPAEVFYGRKQTYHHLRSFGCLAYARPHRSSPGKTDARALPGVFLGYDIEKRAYRIYLPKQRELIVSRDVSFDESKRGWKPTHVPILDSLSLFDPEEEIDMSIPVSPIVTEISAPVPTTSSLIPSASEDLDSLPELENDDIESPPSQQIRRSTRTIKPTLVGLESAANLSWCFLSAPVTATQAARDPRWRQAMQTEVDSLKSLGSFEVVSRPTNKEVIPTRWVYQQKDEKQGKEQYKARLVAKGFKQVYGIDYDQTWAPTARANSIRLVVALAARDRSFLRHVDIKTAFLNAKLSHSIYVEPPASFAPEGKVWLLRKALYGLKQAGKEWCDDLSGTLKEMGFYRSLADPCVYCKSISGTLVIIVVHVDDLFIKYDTPAQLAAVIQGLQKHYKLSDLGEVKNALGIDFTRNNDTIVMSQSGYTKTVLERFGFEAAHPSHIPSTDSSSIGKPTGLEKFELNAIVGALLWLSLNTRPDISYAVARLAQFVAKPSPVAYAMAARILRYLTGSMEYSISFTSKDRQPVLAYADADWAGDSDRRSQSGYIFLFAGGPIAWSSRKQTCVALSTAEAEIVAASACVQDAIWFMSILSELGMAPKKPITIFEDNEGAIALAETSVTGKRTKHIDLRYSFINDAVKTGKVLLTKVDSKKNLADVFTKGLARERFTDLIRRFVKI